MKNKAITKLQEFFPILLISAVSGCSTNSAYYGTQQYQINQCIQASSQSVYDECVKQLDKSFEEYKQQRNETLEIK